MEGLQGPAICHRIRLMDRHLPILGITSFSINSYRSRLMEAGAQGLIGKEDSNQLAKAIERLCGGNVMEGFEPPALANVRIRREEETSPRLTVREEQIISCAPTACWTGRSPNDWTSPKAPCASICRAFSRS